MKALKFTATNTGCYKCVSHATNGEGYYNVLDGLLHRMLYEAIHGKGPGEIHHLCENRWCCNPRHLVRMSSSDHHAHHIKNGKYSPKRIAQIHPEHGLLKIWDSSYQLGKAGFIRQHVQKVCSGIRDTHAGCWWMYVSHCK